MTIVFLSVALFGSLLQLLVIADIVCSWISLFLGRVFRPSFIAAAVDPLYAAVAGILPTRLGPFDFSAVYIVIACELVISLAVAIDPAILQYLPN